MINLLNIVENLIWSIPRVTYIYQHHFFANNELSWYCVNFVTSPNCSSSTVDGDDDWESLELKFDIQLLSNFQMPLYWNRNSQLFGNSFCWYMTLYIYVFAGTWLNGNLTLLRWEILNLPHLLQCCCPKTLPPWFKTIYCCCHMVKLVMCQNLTCTSSAPDNQRGSWMMRWNFQMSKCLAEHNPPKCTHPNCLKREGSWW